MDYNIDFNYLEIENCEELNKMILEIVNNIIKQQKSENYNTNFFFNYFINYGNDKLTLELALIYQLVYIILTINFTLPSMISDCNLVNIKKPFHEKYGVSNTYLLLLILTSKIVNRYNTLIKENDYLKCINITDLININVNELNFDNLNSKSLLNMYYNNIRYLIQNIVKTHSILYKSNKISAEIIYKEFINI